jgi:hypothetical protein
MGQQPGATRFEDTSNDLLLSRLRLYSNWKINDSLRFYVEGLLAEVTADADYLPRPTDVYRGVKDIRSSNTTLGTITAIEDQ